MAWVTPSIIAVLAGSSILTLAYFYLAMQERDRGLLIWAFAWAFQIIRYLFDLFHVLKEGQSPALHSVLQTGNYLAAIVTGFLLLWGTYVFIGKRLPGWWVIVILATSVWVLISGLFFFSFMASTLPTFTLQGIIFIMTGTALLRHRDLGKAARTITGWAFIIWGAHKLEYFIARQIKALVPWGYLLSAVLEIVVALGIILAYFQKTREKLKESEEKYHSLFEKSQSIKLIIDPKTGAYLDANPAACSFYGYTREEMKKKFIWDINTLSREEIFEQMESMWKDNRTLFQFQHRLAGGEVRDVEVYTGPIKYDGQQVLYSLVHDITERKRAEAAIQGAFSEWQSTFDAISGSICLIDGDGKIIRHNKATELLLGKPSSEIAGHFCWEAVHGLSAPIEDCPIVRMRKSLRRETLVIRTGDSWLEVTVDPLLDKGGNLRGGVHVITDITARKKMEEEILKAQKLESLSILAGGIAHDFNNILTGILGNISFAGMLLDREPLRAAERLAEAEQASLRAKDLTHQLLTFSKGGSPIRSLRDIKSLIEEAARFATRGSIVSLRFEIAQDLWAAEVDEGQINQVVNNLVINAVQAMPEGGTITIRADNIVLREGEKPFLKAGNYVRISIQDQGMGIPAHLLGKIFDPFFTTKQKGSGLGLSTVYNIIRNHNGSIALDSTLGAGSAFTFHLPASSQTIPRAVETGDITERFDARVLVMDDEPMVRDLAGVILRSLGCTVQCAEDGQAMLKMYREAKDSGEPYDLVIMDLTVPGGMGGKEAIKELLSFDPGAKAIVSSGYSNDPIMAECLRYGFTAILVKPYRIKEMFEALRKTLRPASPPP